MRPYNNHIILCYNNYIFLGYKFCLSIKLLTNFFYINKLTNKKLLNF